MDKRKKLEQALEAQFRDVDDGSDGQKKKESVETLKVLYDLSMTQDKADQDSEFRESEMLLKEREMNLKEAEQKVNAEIKDRELKIKESELAIKKTEILNRKIEIGLGVGTLASGLYGQHLYKKNFNQIYKIETSDTFFVPVAQRAASYMKNIERLAIQGASKVVFRH